MSVGAVVGRIVGEGIIWLGDQPARVSDWFIPLLFLGGTLGDWLFPLMEAPALYVFSTAAGYTALGALLGYAPVSPNRKRYLKRLAVGLGIWLLATYLLLLNLSAFLRFNGDFRWPE